jgi:hypothetical protein
MALCRYVCQLQFQDPQTWETGASRPTPKPPPLPQKNPSSGGRRFSRRRRRRRSAAGPKTGAARAPCSLSLPNHTSRPPHLLYVASANPALRSPKPHLPGSDLSSGRAGGEGGIWSPSGPLSPVRLELVGGRRCGDASDHLRRPVLPLGGGLTTGARRRLRWQTLQPPVPPTSPCSRGAPRVWTVAVSPPNLSLRPQAAGAVVRYAPLSVLSAVLQQVGFESPGEILAWLCASDGNDDTSGAVLPPWRRCLEAIPNPRGCANSDV